ncbi:MAG: DNA-binding domain-containing protein [Bacteroidales bacterium]|nr:DNA-binding domain-containing protein [Bacteroidales bacterium]MCF8404432.1 DNA-binding domain-containing protein [Bacteroidales bacterium]
MKLNQDTYQQQSSFAEYCRTNELSENLLVRKDRVHHYRRLVYNVIDDSLQTAFPLTFDLLLDEEWEALVSYYFSTHKSKSSQIWQMPKEFYLFYKTSEHPLKSTYPYLVDLLYFEWTEIEVFMMEDIKYPDVLESGDLEHDVLKLNPEHKILHLNYPVHLKNGNMINEKDKADYFVLLYRERPGGKVQFVDLSLFFALLLENIHAKNTIGQIILSLVEEYELDSYQNLMANTFQFIKKLREKGFILGFSGNN